MPAFRPLELRRAGAAGRPLRSLMPLLGLLLTACAITPPGEPGIALETAARGQPLAGATCVATIGPMRWDVTTPAVLAIGDARGALHIVCDKPGFRSSELIFRPESGVSSGVSAGFGSGGYGSGIGLGLSFPLGGASARYPKRLVIDLNPA